ncbi:hypothetical protein MKX01_032924 [Papaver californicum]|nr:hypothetical protein MKX01_032924 [Papaver californicum]
MGSLGIWLSVLFGFILSTWNSTVIIIETNAMPPPSLKDCRVQRVTYPKPEEELLLAVSEANKKKLKVKIVTGFSHSIPKLACPLQNSSILISTAKCNSGIDVDVKKMTVTVDSGVGLRNLIDEVEEAGLSLVVSPYWEAHGSSWWGKGGAVHDHIVGISVIVAANNSDGYAKIIQLDAQNPLFNAARVSLGMLGAISKHYERIPNDTNLEKEFMDLALTHEFADVTWYPSLHTTVYRKDDRVPLNTTGDGINDFIGFQPTPTFISESTRSTEENMEKTRDTKEKCKWESVLVEYKQSLAHGLKKDQLSFTGYPVWVVKEKCKLPLNKFLEAKQVLDPGNMFSANLLDEMVFRKELANMEGCAMEGQCICSEDKHCNPGLGYLCQPGLVYTEAKVCRPSC